MAYYAKLDINAQETLTGFIDSMLDEQIISLQEQIRIPSTKQAPAEGCPFGKPMAYALEHMLELARGMGFSAENIDNYAGLIEYGEGDETLGVLAHLDVVPAGEGWSLDAFGGEICDGYIYGRGTMDDKGPAMSALYALYAIKRSGIRLKRKVQLILGCDEESGWACMKHYKTKKALPDIAFTPDAEYPLVYSERTIIRASYSAPAEGSQVRVECGERANVVPARARAVVPVMPPAVDMPEGFSMDISNEGALFELIVNGLGGHAATPENGRNALQMALSILAKLPLNRRDADAAKALHEAFMMDMHGETLGLDVTDESGRLTINPGILRWDDDKIRFTIDARSPKCLDADTLISRIGAALAPAGFTLESCDVKEGLFVSKEHMLVETLMGVYRAQTGDMESEPLAIGGGTYARAMPLAVAFGCEYPGSPGLAHMPNERVSTQDIRKNTHMLADAIIALGN